MKTTHTYKCKCGSIQTEGEMRREYDFGYDQSCCFTCGDIMVNNLHGIYYYKPLKQ